MPWVTWCLLVFGLVYFGVAASISETPRRWLYRILGRFGHLGNFSRGVLACGPCFAFWVGLIMGLPVNSLDPAYLQELGLPAWSINHVIGAFCAMAYIAIVQYFAGIAISSIARDEAAVYAAKAQENIEKQDFDAFSEKAIVVLDCFQGVLERLVETVDQTFFGADHCDCDGSCGKHHEN